MQSTHTQEVSPATIDVASDNAAAINPEKEETTEEIAEDDDQEIPESTLSLPISKIKRVFKTDPDYFAASQSAVYATGIATELFIQYFVEQASMFAKVDKRKKIQYKDFSNAVASHDSLTFLSDTVPKTAPIGDLVRKKAVTVDINEDIAMNEDGQGDVEPEQKQHLLPKGQQTLHFSTNAPSKKAVIHDLVINEDNNSSEDVVMAE